MNRPINVLLLDDKADKMEDFKLEAKRHRVLIKKSLTNSKDGIKDLRENHKQYDAVILDAYFFEEVNLAKKPSAYALAKTIKEIERILYVEERQLPHCIYTGQFDDEKNLKIKGDSAAIDKQIFVKGRDQDAMFKYLKKEAERSEEYLLKNKFNDVFEVFDYGFMPQDKMPDLIEIVKKLTNNAKYNRDGSFTPLRKMYEAFVKSFFDEAFKNDKNQDLVALELFSGPFDEKVNIKGSWFYFSGLDVKSRDGQLLISARHEPVFPEHIKNITSGFIDLIQTESHDYSDPVTKYAYNSAVNALLELLFWYKNFCLKNFKNEN